MKEAAFTKLPDLVAERLGGKTLIANDEFFAPKESLIKEGRGIFIPEKYTEQGKWMDGWETRRRRIPGNDWCVIKLAHAGKIVGFDIDTHHFLGNHPPHASVQGIFSPNGTPDPESGAWVELLEKSSLLPHSRNFFDCLIDFAVTHIRLSIFPDGGVARFRAYGIFEPGSGEGIIELSSCFEGGAAFLCSDMFFSHMNNLLVAGRSTFMGDGWETKRRRGPGYDWCVIRLGRCGVLERIEVDTNHFKGNFPDSCSIEISADEGPSPREAVAGEGWISRLRFQEILPQTKLRAHTQHFFEAELRASQRARWVRLNIYPDGGVSRFRVWGTPK